MSDRELGSQGKTRLCGPIDPVRLSAVLPLLQGSRQGGTDGKRRTKTKETIVRHTTRLAGIIALLAFSGGCGSSDPHDAAVKEMLAAMNELADVMDTVKDEASATAAAPKLKAVADRVKALKTKMDGMPKPTAEVEESLKKKYEEQMKNVMGRLMAAGMKASSVPGAQAAFQEAMKAMQ
jgi:hypothetical protein